MRSIDCRTTPLRRVLVACTAGAMSLGVLPAAHAQEAPSPTPVSIDDLCAAVPATDGFEDVGDQAWAEAVRCLAYAGITTGVSPNRYGPASAVTRQQMASFIARTIDMAEMLDPADDLTSLPAWDPTDGPFTDLGTSVPGTHVISIERLAAAGIVEGGPAGLPETSFGPHLRVTRAQMASFINRALRYLTGADEVPGADHFDDDETSVHEDNVNVLADAGVVVGYGEGSYRPDAPVQRNSMASFIVRSLAHLEREDAVTALPSPPDTDVPLAVASSDGVVVTDADGSPDHVVSTDPGAVAYAVGPDLVVYQDADARGTGPWGATGPVRVWTPDGVEALPMAADMTSARLYDARVVDGVPTALVAEDGGVRDDYADSRSELFLVDLTDGTRTTIERADDGERAEMGYGSGRILADGDVVIVDNLTGDSWLERWSPGEDGPRWTTDDLAPMLSEQIVEQDGAIHLVQSSGDGRPTIVVTDYDVTTGARGTSSTVTVPDFGGRGSDFWSCTDLLTDDVLACNRRDQEPIGIDLTTGWFETLPGGADAFPTEVRGGAAG